MNLGAQTRATREASLGWRIQRLAGWLDREMARALAPLGLTQQGFAVMMTVLEHGPLTQAEIGRRFGMPAYAISRALDALEQAGLVARRPHAASRRAHAITATAQGEALAPRLFEVVEGVNARLAASLDGEERDRLGCLLSILLADLRPEDR